MQTQIISVINRNKIAFKKSEILKCFSTCKLWLVNVFSFLFVAIIIWKSKATQSHRCDDTTRTNLKQYIQNDQALKLQCCFCWLKILCSQSALSVAFIVWCCINELKHVHQCEQLSAVNIHKIARMLIFSQYCSIKIIFVCFSVDFLKITRDLVF